MKKEFIEKVIRTGTVDTGTYRYAVKEYADHMEIRRIPLSDLDTTAALDGWETVWTSEEASPITLEEIADQMISNSDHSFIDDHFKQCRYLAYFDGEEFETWADINMSWEGLERYREICDDIEFHVGYHLDEEYTRSDLDRDIDIALSRFDDQETLDNPCFRDAAEDLLDQIKEYLANKEEV